MSIDTLTPVSKSVWPGLKHYRGQKRKDIGIRAERGQTHAELGRRRNRQRAQQLGLDVVVGHRGQHRGELADAGAGHVYFAPDSGKGGGIQLS